MSLIILSEDSLPSPFTLVHGTEEWAVELISSRFVDAWPTAMPGVAYSLEGEPAASVDRFVSLMIQLTPNGRQLTLGRHPKLSRTGRIWVKIWTPAVATGGAVGGTKARAQLADAARVVFERNELTEDAMLEPLAILTGQTQTGGVDGRWMLSAVSFDFTWWTTGADLS
jgi:hypothetical protein